MWVRRGHLHCAVTRADEEELRWLRDYLTFTDTKARFRRGGRKGRDSGEVGMFNVLANTFPAGLYHLVRAAAEDMGFEFETDDARTRPAEFDGSGLGWLRDYQREAVDRIHQRQHGIIWCPTGSGKTEIAIGAVLALPCRWLFLVHRATLMHQAAERYELRTGERAGRIGEGVWFVPDDTSLVVATFQTLHAALKKKKGTQAQALLEACEGLIVDECHTLPADSFWRVAMKTANAYFRVGMSGTPLARGDRRSVLAIAALGPVLYRIKATELIDRGLVAKPRIRMVPFEHEPCDAKTWKGVYGQCIVRNRARNSLVVEAARRATKPAFLFVNQIHHGKAIEKALWKAGIRCAFVWGSHSTEWREQAIKELVRGAIDVLVTSVVLQEGVDVPELRAVINASAGRSVIAALQRIGRGMRPEHDEAGNVVPGSDTFEVWDVADTGCGCKEDKGKGGTHQSCRWLSRHTRERTRAYAAEGYEVVEAPEVLPRFSKKTRVTAQDKA